MEALAHMQAHMPPRYASVVEHVDATTKAGLQQLHTLAEAQRQKQLQ